MPKVKLTKTIKVQREEARRLRSHVEVAGEKIPIKNINGVFFRYRARMICDMLHGPRVVDGYYVSIRKWWLFENNVWVSREDAHRIAEEIGDWTIYGDYV